jgi:hypothetical protein
MGHESYHVQNVDLLQFLHLSTAKSILFKRLVGDVCVTFSINRAKAFLYLYYCHSVTKICNRSARLSNLYIIRPTGAPRFYIKCGDLQEDVERSLCHFHRHE